MNTVYQLSIIILIITFSYYIGFIYNKSINSKDFEFVFGFIIFSLIITTLYYLTFNYKLTTLIFFIIAFIALLKINTLSSEFVTNIFIILVSCCAIYFFLHVTHNLHFIRVTDTSNHIKNLYNLRVGNLDYYPFGYYAIPSVMNYFSDQVAVSKYYATFINFVFIIEVVRNIVFKKNIFATIVFSVGLLILILNIDILRSYFSSFWPAITGYFIVMTYLHLILTQSIVFKKEIIIILWMGIAVPILNFIVMIPIIIHTFLTKNFKSATKRLIMFGLSAAIFPIVHYLNYGYLPLYSNEKQWSVHLYEVIIKLFTPQINYNLNWIKIVLIILMISIIYVVSQKSYLILFILFLFPTLFNLFEFAGFENRTFPILFIILALALIDKLKISIKQPEK